MSLISHLGILHNNQRKLNKAEGMLQWAYKGHKKKTFGPEHIWKLRDVSHLGTLSCSQGKLNEAVEMLQRAY